MNRSPYKIGIIGLGGMGSGYLKTRRGSDHRDGFGTVSGMKALLQTVSSRRVPAPPKKRLLIRASLSLIAWVAVCADTHAEYEYYKGAQFPGAELRKDIELRTVIKPGGKPTEYKRREVKFYPRKGVDNVPVVDGMIEREWTFTEEGMKYAPDRFTRNGRLNAHLYGFRGVGVSIGKERDGKRVYEPGIVLRLPDGTKKMYPQGSFSEADLDFVMPIFNKEMQRIAAGLNKDPRYAPANSKYPNIAKPGEPGTMQIETDHFVWLSGTQTNPDNPGPFIGKTLEDGAHYRAFVMEWCENMWGLYEYSGSLMLDWERSRMRKHTVEVAGTIRDGYQTIPGFAGGGRGGCIAKESLVEIIGHEFGHGLQINERRVGGGEAGADTAWVFCFPSAKGNSHFANPARNIFNGFAGYGMTGFWSTMGDDPNFGYGWFDAIPFAASENNVMLAIARVIEQRGMAQNGIRGFGDLVGEYAARLATFDFELGPYYRQQFYAPLRHWLDPVDRAKNIWRIPHDFSPEPFGMNLIRLVPEEGAKSITVDFMGMHNPKSFSDWRACMVRVLADGAVTYSHLFSKGTMEMDVAPDDAAIWLTVAATPTAMYQGLPEKGRDNVPDRMVYSGLHTFRYPWQVQLTGCTPGSPQRFAGEYGGNKQYGYKKYISRNHDDEFTVTQTSPYVLRTMEKPVGGTFHPNGGGWVADTATVAPTAYVGKEAMVLDNAQVLDHARVEDYAIIKDTAVIKDHAKISGPAVVSGAAVFDAYKRTWCPSGPSGHDIFKNYTDFEPDAVPHRPPLRTEAHEHKLWANYAMDTPDAILLPDFFRYQDIPDRDRYGRLITPNLDGYVRGNPTFVADGDRLGLQFDGKTQSAELSPRVFDLGQATVDMTIRLDGNEAGTIFDFGSSVENSLVLSANAGGELALVATVKGNQAFSLRTPAVTRGAWVRVRIEMDGKVVSLYVDGKQVAGKKTPVRPCDFYPPEAIKTNTIARDRRGTSPLAVSFDNLVFYYGVHQAFDELPPPTFDVPIVPNEEFVLMYKQHVDQINAYNAEQEELAAAKGNTTAVDLDGLAAATGMMKGRKQALIERHDAYHAAKEQLAAKEKQAQQMRKQFMDEFDQKHQNTPETVERDETESRMESLKSALAEMKKEMSAEDVDRQAEKKRARLEGQLKQVTDTYQMLRNEYNGKRDVYATLKTRDLKMEIIGLKQALDEATQAAVAEYEPEIRWIDALSYMAFGRYYNFNYAGYDNARKQSGSTARRVPRSRLNDVTQLRMLDDPRVWRTEFDWDWRMATEQNGSIESLPLMKQWLQKNRGPVQQTNPALKTRTSGSPF